MYRLWINKLSKTKNKCCSKPYFWIISNHLYINMQGVLNLICFRLKCNKHLPFVLSCISALAIVYTAWTVGLSLSGASHSKLVSCTQEATDFSLDTSCPYHAPTSRTVLVPAPFCLHSRIVLCICKFYQHQMKTAPFSFFAKCPKFLP